MAVIQYRILQIRGAPHTVKMVFRSALLRWFPIGGVTLTAKTIRFKRDRDVVPRELVAHELGHVLQAKRLGWRYLPTYLFRKRQMEREADDGVATMLAVYPWLDRFGSMYPSIANS